MVEGTALEKPQRSNPLVSSNLTLTAIGKIIAAFLVAFIFTLTETEQVACATCVRIRKAEGCFASNRRAKP